MKTLVALLTVLALLSCSTEEPKTRTSPIILKPETPADTQPNTLHGSYKLVKVDTVHTSPIDNVTTTYAPPEATGKMTLDIQRRTQCCMYGYVSIDVIVPVQQININGFYISSSEDSLTLEWELKNEAGESIGRIIGGLQIEWDGDVLVMQFLRLSDSDYYHRCHWIKNQP